MAKTEKTSNSSKPPILTKTAWAVGCVEGCLGGLISRNATYRARSVSSDEPVGIKIVENPNVACPEVQLLAIGYWESEPVSEDGLGDDALICTRRTEKDKGAVADFLVLDCRCGSGRQTVKIETNPYKRLCLTISIMIDRGDIDFTKVTVKFETESC